MIIVYYTCVITMVVCVIVIHIYTIYSVNIASINTQKDCIYNK